MGDSFRVSMRFEDDSENEKTYLVFVDRSLLKTVRDLENHVKTTLGMAEDVTLLVDNCVLPSNESIAVVFSTDCIRIRRAKMVETEVHNDQENKNTKNRQTSNRNNSRTTKKILTSVGSVLTRYMEDNSRQDSDVGETNSFSKDDANKSNQNDESLTVQESSHSGLEPKKKRKRKHSKKKQSTSEVVQNEPSELPIIFSSSFAIHSSSCVANHSYFSSSEEMETNEQNAIVIEDENSTDVKRNNTLNKSTCSDDWSDALLTIAKKSLPEKTFSRLRDSVADQNGIAEKILPSNFDPEKFPIIDKVKENDVVSFKIIKIGADYCPTQSKNIIAKVLKLYQNSQVDLKILQGKEEFDIPEGKLFIEGTTNFSRQGVVQLNFNEMLETRLIFP